MAQLFGDPFTDQGGLVDAARRGGVPDSLVFIFGQWNADNVRPVKDAIWYFLEFGLEVCHVVALPERR